MNDTPIADRILHQVAERGDLLLSDIRAIKELERERDEARRIAETLASLWREGPNLPWE